MKTCFTAEMKGLQAASYERTDYYGDNDRGDFHSHERFGIGIVRMSGPESMDVISRIYRSKNGGKNIKEVKSHTIHYGYIFDGEEVVDEVLVMVMRAPRTYTGEDTVEIDCHGGVYAMKKVLETVLRNGAQIAEPG